METLVYLRLDNNCMEKVIKEKWKETCKKHWQLRIKETEYTKEFLGVNI